MWSDRGTLASETKAGVTTSSSFDVFGEATVSGSVSSVYDGLGRIATRNGTAFKYSGLGQDVVSDGTSVFGRSLGGAPISSLDSFREVSVLAEIGAISLVWWLAGV